MVDYDQHEYETKGDRRAKKRYKDRTSQIGIPVTKIRLTGEAELRAKVRKARRAKKRQEENVDNV